MIRKLLRRDEAQSLAEFAIVLPMFLILVFGVIDFGMGLRAYISISAATREGARYAAVGNPSGGTNGTCAAVTAGTVRNKVCQTITGLDLTDVQNVKVEYVPSNTPGNSVRVTADYNYEYITPVRGIINVLSGGSIGSSLTISATTDMRLE